MTPQSTYILLDGGLFLMEAYEWIFWLPLILAVIPALTNILLPIILLLLATRMDPDYMESTTKRKNMKDILAQGVLIASFILIIAGIFIVSSNDGGDITIEFLDFKIRHATKGIVLILIGAFLLGWTIKMFKENHSS